jgi:hypothetical protein
MVTVVGERETLGRSPHEPTLQPVVAEHTSPHAPQFLLSVCVLVQLPLHKVSPVWHPRTQVDADTT